MSVVIQRFLKLGISIIVHIRAKTHFFLEKRDTSTFLLLCCIIDVAVIRSYCKKGLLYKLHKRLSYITDLYKNFGTTLLLMSYCYNHWTTITISLLIWEFMVFHKWIFNGRKGYSIRVLWAKKGNPYWDILILRAEINHS